MRYYKSLLINDQIFSIFQKGGDVMIDPNVSDSEAKASYNDIKTVMLPSGRTYLRIVPQPIDA